MGNVLNNQVALWACLCVLCVLVNSSLLYKTPSFIPPEDYANFLFDSPKFSWRALLLAIATGSEPTSRLVTISLATLMGNAPRGYILVNLAVHCLVVCMLLSLTVRLLFLSRPHEVPPRIWGCSFIVVALYAIHPLRAEVVAWGSGLPWSCASLAMLASISWYVDHGVCVTAWERTDGTNGVLHTPPPQRFLWQSLGAYVVAVSLKNMVAPLPICFLLLDYAPLRRRISLRLVTEKWIFIAVTSFVVQASLAAHIIYPARMVRTVPPSTLHGKFSLASYGLVLGLRKLLWPRGLYPNYFPPPGNPSLSNPHYLFPALFLVLLTYRLVSNVRQFACPLLCWIAYLCFMIPSVTLFYNDGEWITADRFSYLSHLVLVPAFVGAAIDLLQIVEESSLQWQQAVFLVIILVFSLLGGMGLLSAHQVGLWASRDAIWAHTLHEEQTAYGHFRLGLHLLSEGKPEVAAPILEQGLSIAPHDHALLEAYCISLVLTRRHAEAIPIFEELFRQGMRTRPDFSATCGVAYYFSRDMQRARDHWLVTLQLDDQHPVAKVGLAYLDARTSSLPGSVPRSSQVVLRDVDPMARIKPIHHVRETILSAPHLFGRGLERERDKDWEGAEIYYETALTLDPMHHGALHCLGRLLYVDRGEYDRAEMYLRQAVESADSSMAQPSLLLLADLLETVRGDTVLAKELRQRASSSGYPFSGHIRSIPESFYPSRAGWTLPPPRQIEAGKCALGLNFRLNPLPFPDGDVVALHLARLMLESGRFSPFLLQPWDHRRIASAAASTPTDFMDKIPDIHDAVRSAKKQSTTDHVSVEATVLHLLGGMPLGVYNDMARGTQNVALVSVYSIDQCQLFAGKHSSYDLILAASTFSATLLEKCGVEKERLRTIPLAGVNPSIFFPDKKAVKLFPGHFVIFTGGPLEYRRGADLVIASFKAFKQNHPEARLLTAWTVTSQELLKELREGGYVVDRPMNSSDPMILEWLEANGLQATDIISPPSQISLPTLLHSVDVAVFPSRVEGGPDLSALQTMASGVPTLLTAHAGHLDLLENLGSHCFPLQTLGRVRATSIHKNVDLWAEASVEEIVERLEDIYNNRQSARKKVRKISGVIKKHWTWDVMGQRIARSLEVVNAACA